MSKHILIVTNHFYPEQFRINDIALAWVERGYQVSVLTQKPNYPKGSFYKGYANKENYKGINITRLPVIPRGKNPVMLMLNYLSYWFTSFIFSCFTSCKPDLVFAYQTSPIFMLRAANRIAHRNKVPVYHYILDMWPDNLYALVDIPLPFYHSLMSRYCRRTYQKSDLSFISSRPFAQQLENLEAKKSLEPIYWPQHAEDVYKRVNFDGAYKYLKNPKALNVIFTGNIGTAQGLDFLIEVCLNLKNRQNSDIHFHMVGDGRYRTSLEKNITQQDLGEYFSFYGQRPMSEIPYFLAEADLGMISFVSNQIFETTVPAKLQSYMACGIPIISYAKGEVNRIIEESKAGYAITIGDIEGFVSALLDYESFDEHTRSKYIEAAYQYFMENFNKETLLDKMDTYLHTI